MSKLLIKKNWTSCV